MGTGHGGRPARTRRAVPARAERRAAPVRRRGLRRTMTTEFDDHPGTIRRRTGLQWKDPIMEKAKGLAALQNRAWRRVPVCRSRKGLRLRGLGHAVHGGRVPEVRHRGHAARVRAGREIVNPTHDFWVSVATNAAIVDTLNTLVVFGEVAIGIALILGFATRFAGVMGAILMGAITLGGLELRLRPDQRDRVSTRRSPLLPRLRRCRASPTVSMPTSRRPRSSPTGRHSTTCSDSDPALPSSRAATRTVTTGGTRKGPAGCL